jgi:hypothetical protein
MDHKTLALFIPILALSIPVVAIVFRGLERIARARALGQGGEDVRAHLAALEDEMGALREETVVLRQELADAQERIDFAERLLAQREPPAQLRDPESGR